MNPLGQPLQHKVNYKMLGIFAAIGLVLFILFQVVPSTATDTLGQSNTKVISKERAEQAARQFAESSLHIKPGLEKALVTYQSKSDFYGYLSREKLVAKYDKSFEKRFPYDIYRVRLSNQTAGGYVNIDLHMSTGKVLAFTYDPPHTKYAAAMLEMNQQARQKKLRIVEGNMALEDKEELADPWLKQSGYDASELQLLTSDQEPGLVYNVNGQQIGKSQLQLKFTYEDGQLRSFQPDFTIPASHTAYVNKQTSIATWLTLVGYGLLTLVLGILAIIYSVKTRQHTSFARGIFLSLFYFAVSVLSVVNMIPYLQGEGLSEPILIIGIVLQAVLNLALSALLYFSLVGGDGLWRKLGINPWPRAKEPGYGKYVLGSMYSGYLWAFVLLGVQSIIYIVLNNTIHSWSTTDASQSPFNMLYPWLLPVMAWMAGISEEAIYRLFGIPMMKKIVKNTFIACLIPTLIWAFGHTLYPIYPVSSRPIELVFIGLLFSFIFLRYGYITAMFSHVVFDSILMGFSLFVLGDIGSIAAGIVAMIIPFIVAYVIYWFTKNKKEKPYITAPHPEGHQ